MSPSVHAEGHQGIIEARSIPAILIASEQELAHGSMARGAPGKEPSWRYYEKPKHCADLHRFYAGLRVSDRGRLRAAESGRNRVESGRLGDRWATASEGAATGELLLRTCAGFSAARGCTRQSYLVYLACI